MNNKKTILIADDEEAYRTLFSKKLIDEGFSVIETKDGEETLLVALEKHPDLILLDLGMPKMDGLTMLKKLREDSWGKNALVFILTNTSDTAKLAEAVQFESFVYLVKSNMSLEELVSKVKQQLSAHA